MQVTCMLCRKTYVLDQRNPQYMRMKQGLSKQYVCAGCNNSLQQDAQRHVEFDPSLIDDKGYDKLV